MNAPAKKHATQELSTIRDRFLAINTQRLERIQSSLTTRQAQFLELLPLFFQLNHPELPGFVSKTTPAGVYGYANNDSTTRLAKRLFRLLDQDFRIPTSLQIDAIYLMGSSGTIAYNDKSDFDIWILHNDSLDVDQVDELVSKTAKIEQWCESLKLEVHFFVFSAEQFKRGELNTLSNESSGNTQFYLLLDEFYRSSVLISGKQPAWWLIPADATESQHQHFINTLSTYKDIDSNDFIDFGNLSNAPINEFFTASVWQLYKSIHSPYKSLLKLLLIERYAREYPNINFLSQRYKQSVYAGNIDIYDIDPYLMLYYKLEDFLLDIGQGKLLDLVRKCLYIKVNEKLSSPKQSSARWRYLTMQKLTDRWGWNNHHFKHMDNIHEWRLEDVLDVRQRLINALITSYRFLSDFAREHTEKIHFDKNELNILGRRLFSAFERKNNKIDLINYGIAPDIFEDKISLLDIKNKKQEYQWLLFRDTVKPDNIKEHSVLKQNKHLMELVCWLYFNEIAKYNSRILITNRYHDIDILNLDKVLNSLGEVFPRQTEKHTKNDLFEFNQTQKIKQAAIYINIALPIEKHTHDKNNFLSSNRDDVLSYGGRHKNLVDSLDLIIETTWKEVLHFRYEGYEGIMQCLCNFFNWFPADEKLRPSAPPLLCYLNHYNKVIIKRFELLFESIIDAFYSEQDEKLIRYVFEIEGHYMVLSNENNHYEYTILDNYDKLKKHLTKPCEEFNKTIFDTKSVWPDNFPKLYEYNKPDSIQVFYFVKNNIADVHVLDEKGSYFTQQVDFVSRDLLIHHYQLFIHSSIERRKFLLSHELNHKSEYKIDFYNIHCKYNKEYIFNKCKQLYGKHEKFYFPVQVIGKIDDDANQSISIFCREKEFSTNKHGKYIFKKTAEFILQQRREKEKYPIYITDIDILDNMFADNKQVLQTTHFLDYKKRIEQKLNNSLEELS